MSDKKEFMPVGSPSFGRIDLEFPMSLLNEEQAYNNHGQTLQRLAERGGLSPCEAVAIIEKRGWHRMNEGDAIAQLKGLL